MFIRNFRDYLSFYNLYRKHNPTIFFLINLIVNKSGR